MSLNKGGNFYSLNIEKLLLKYPSFKTDILHNYSPSKQLTVSDTAEGFPTARIDNHWIHSSRYPKKEAERLVQSGITKKSGVCLVFGFGLGYHIESLMKQFPGLSILVIEPEPELFLEAMGIRDFTDVIESEQVGFLLKTDSSSLSPILNRFKTINFQSLKLRSIYERNIEYYKTVDEEFAAFIRKRETNINTLNRFGKTWTRNLFRNIEVFSGARDAGLWYGLFREFPALVIAAGPSLDELLPVLPQLKRRCLLICVDTALRAVLSSGTAPDFVVVVDPQYLNTRHLDNLLDSEMLSDSLLISESSTHPAVFRNCRIPVFFFKSVFPLGKLIERQAGIVSELGAGGSVATTAWDFARKLGCAEIYTAGLDLGYPGKRTHCRTSLSSMFTQLRTNRKLSVDALNFSGITNADPFMVENNTGGVTLTDNRLIIYKWWFEGQIKSSPRDGLFNLSAEGVKIEGMKYREKTELLEKSEIRGSIDGILRELLGADAVNNAEPGFENVRNLVQTIITECRRLEKICLAAAETLKKLSPETEQSKLQDGLRKLSEFDRQISNSPSKELTGFIIQPVLNEIIDEEKSMFENSEKLYGSIIGACEYHRVHAERALIRIQLNLR